jgi:AcrR family transcriptional regulator
MSKQTDSKVTENMREPKFKRRADARPDEVLDAALALFTDNGFAKTTVDQIASKAGISKGAVYNYFPSKKAILEGLVHRAVGPVIDQASAVIGGSQGDPRPLIRQIMGMFLSVMSRPNAFSVPILVIREAVNAPEIAQIYRTQVLEKVIPPFVAMIERGVAGKHIRAVDPELTVRSVMGPLMLHIILAKVFDMQPASGFDFDRLIDNHLTILFAGLEPEPEGKG